MNILLTYSSKTGNTKKVAEGIYNILPKQNTEFIPINEVLNSDIYDVIIVGYWIDKGKPNEEASIFMKNISNKKVGVFATLGANPHSPHGIKSLKCGVDILKENGNQVIAEFICQGKIDENLIEKFKTLPKDHPHVLTEKKLERYAIAAKHPNKDDIEKAQTIFKKGIEKL